MELNADLGESWYTQRVGNDAALMPYLDACNIACGFHGGDALTMQQTVVLAIEYGVAIGAHPSFPDRKNFGRSPAEPDLDTLRAWLLYQVSALQGMVRVAGGKVRHLKPHGALYHYANDHAAVAATVVETMVHCDIPILCGPPTGELRKAASAADKLFYAEGFVDRRYEEDLRLRARGLPGACIDDTEAAEEQVRMMLGAGHVRTASGRTVPIDVDTLCVHGDHPGAVEKARAIRQVLDTIPPRG